MGKTLRRWVLLFRVDVIPDNETEQVPRRFRKAVPILRDDVNPDTGDRLLSVSQTLWDRGPVNSFFIRRGPGPNKFTRKYLSNFFKFIH